MKKNKKKKNEKVIKRKENRLYVNWKGYGDLLSCWINTRDIV